MRWGDNMGQDHWCEVLNLYNKNTGDYKRILVCSNRAKYLILDGIELSYKKKGYQLLKTETIGLINEVVKVEFKEE